MGQRSWTGCVHIQIKPLTLDRSLRNRAGTFAPLLSVKFHEDR